MKRKIDLIITVIVFLLFILANIYAVRMIFYYGTQVYLHEKLLVAFQIGGRPALEKELAVVIEADKNPLEHRSAEEFKQKLGKIKDPGNFLEDLSAKEKIEIRQFRNMRSAIFILLLAIFLLRVIMKKTKGGFQ